MGTVYVIRVSWTVLAFKFDNYNKLSLPIILHTTFEHFFILLTAITELKINIYKQNSLVIKTCVDEGEKLKLTINPEINYLNCNCNEFTKVRASI